jgi:ADP-ribose pyrophosphatase YjhB (NUDIX family)
MPKRDHYGTADAPAANDLTPVVQVAVFDEDGALLLIQRADNGLWALPGGFMGVGERFAEAGLRELAEETGVRAEITAIVGVYSDPAHVTEFADGTVHQQCAICFAARHTGGVPTPTAEATLVGFVTRADAPALPMHPTTRLRVEHAFAASGRPYIG